MNIIPLPAFRDNYIWLVHDGRQALVVDPGDAAPVEAALAALDLTLSAILVTHHHPDHTGGLAALLARHPVPVHGPGREQIAGVTHPLAGGEQISALGLAIAVIAVPGHTAGHVAYHVPALQALFCGDTLFSAGCGRLFEGSAAELAQSLAKLAALPDATGVYCTHEYTLSNLAFARVAEPDNAARDAYAGECEARRAAGLPTLPSTLGLEKRINPFLRCAEPGVVQAVGKQAGTPPADPLACLAALRAWKDVF